MQEALDALIAKVTTDSTFEQAMRNTPELALQSDAAAQAVGPKPTRDALIVKLATDPAFKVAMQDDPATALKSDQAKQAVGGGRPAYLSDTKFYRWAIVGLLGLIVVIALFGFVVEVGWSDKQLPGWMTALATTALGAVIGVFAPSPVANDAGAGAGG